MQRDPFDLVGDVLDGQFRVESVAGVGDLSVVYRGYHVGVEAPVAIKCLDLPETLDPALAQPLVLGFKQASRMHYRLARGHLHIAQTIASGSTIAPRTGAAVAYLVREWFEGESLASDLARRRTEGRRGRSLEEALALLETAFDAVAYAHAQGEVHWSISPGNLFLARPGGADRTPVLKVLDFGMARTMGAIASRTPGAGLHLLAPAYGAPEQFDRTIGELGPATDVYALALVMMEVLSDRVVMAEAETSALIERALDDRRRPTPKGHGLTLPAQVDGALTRALSRAPGRRQKSAGDLWRELRGPMRTTTLGSMFAVPPPSASARPSSAPAPVATGPAALSRPRMPIVAGLSPPAPTALAVALSDRSGPRAPEVVGPPPLRPTSNGATAIALDDALEPAEAESAVKLRAESVVSLRPLPVEDPPAAGASGKVPASWGSLRDALERCLEHLRHLRASTRMVGSALEGSRPFGWLVRGGRPRPEAAVGVVLMCFAAAILIRTARHPRAVAAASVPSVQGTPATVARPVANPAPAAAAAAAAAAATATATATATAAPEAPPPVPAEPPAEEPVAGPGTPFEKQAALRALDTKWRKAARCRRGRAWGMTWTNVTFANDGSVDHVDVGWPFVGTHTSECLEHVLAEARVSPFRGGPGVLAYRVWVGP